MVNLHSPRSCLLCQQDMVNLWLYCTSNCPPPPKKKKQNKQTPHSCSKCNVYLVQFSLLYQSRAEEHTQKCCLQATIQEQFQLRSKCTYTQQVNCSGCGYILALQSHLILQSQPTLLFSSHRCWEGRKQNIQPLEQQYTLKSDHFNADMKVACQH